MTTITMDLYGAKCHLCAHLSGSTHNAEPIEGFVLRCSGCLFCQQDELSRQLWECSDMTLPIIRQACQDLFAGRPNAAVEQILRTRGDA